MYLTPKQYIPGSIKSIETLKRKAGNPGQMEQEQSRWIPVTERLPQNYISVLVYIPTAEPLPMLHEAYIGDDGEWHSSGFYGIENEYVTHWMPLPQPPKENGTEKF